jgi:hypothetical protein
VAVDAAVHRADLEQRVEQQQGLGLAVARGEAGQIDLLCGRCRQRRRLGLPEAGPVRASSPTPARFCGASTRSSNSSISLSDSEVLAASASLIALRAEREISAAVRMRASSRPNSVANVMDSSRAGSTPRGAPMASRNWSSRWAASKAYL